MIQQSIESALKEWQWHVQYHNVSTFIQGSEQSDKAYRMK